jgi:hypothetical protein
MQESIFTRRRILQGAATVTAASLLPGCSTSSTPATSTPVPPYSNPQPAPTGALTQATLSVTTVATGTIGPQFIGLSYDKLSIAEPEWTGSNTNMIAMFKRLGVGVLRLGDGSNSVWTPNGKGGVSGQVAPSDVTNLGAFVKAAGVQCIYGTNLAGGYPGYTNGAVATTPALAAAELQYAYSQMGSQLLLEIGNECDNYGYTGGLLQGTNWNLTNFETLWGQFRTAILTTTPSLPVTGPASGGDIPTWTIPFGQYEGKPNLNLLTQHYYRANGALATSTAANLITPDSTLVADLALLKTAAAGIGIPYRISECNSYYNGGAVGVSNSYASSLWAIDFMFNCVQGGSAGVNFHGGSTLAYTAIADNNGTVTGARPLYYGILMFALAGQGTLYTSNLTAGSLNATAYAVKTSGGLNVIINNKDSAQNLQVTISLPQTATTATLMVMTQQTTGIQGPTLTGTSCVTIQGAIVNPDGTFSPNAAYTLTPGTTQLTCYVPYLSAVLIQIT